MKREIITETEKIPVWALCAIINGDYTGLSSEERETIMDWLDETGYDIIAPPQDDDFPYFCSHPAFGLACDVYDLECSCILLE